MNTKDDTLWVKWVCEIYLKGINFQKFKPTIGVCYHQMRLNKIKEKFIQECKRDLEKDTRGKMSFIKASCEWLIRQ